MSANMPVANSPLWASFPSLTAVYADSPTQPLANHSASSSSSMPSAPATGPLTGGRRDSASTVASSLDSSPILVNSRRHLLDSKPLSNSLPTLPGIERTESPNKKMRNMKNLSVNTHTSHRPSTTKLGTPPGTAVPALKSPYTTSAPPSPAFILPPKPPRRKPSNLGVSLITAEPRRDSRPSLTLQTPIVRPLGLSQSVSEPLLIPPTPVLPSVSPDSIKQQTLEHVQEEMDYEVPLSREIKSPAYPHGPVCIYDPNIFLYLEPNDVEARQFDVILNVAREVKSPFEKSEAEAALTLHSPHKDQATQTIPSSTVDKAVQVSFDYVSQMFLEPSISISTTTEVKPPEYVHVPWDHNTNVVDDLLALCRLIETRTEQQKRVLVHCQCGVSRSASLLVAYGLYRNPRLSVQEAYDVVKKRSRWIGPNMNLIYQLSEFKGLLMRSAGLISDKLAPRDQFRTLSLCQPGQSSALERPESGALISRAEKAAIVGRPRASTRADEPPNFSMPFSSRIQAAPVELDLSPKTGTGQSFLPQSSAANTEALQVEFEQLRTQSPMREVSAQSQRPGPESNSRHDCTI